jgi:hypothetical protein
MKLLLSYFLLLYRFVISPISIYLILSSFPGQWRALKTMALLCLCVSHMHTCPHPSTENMPTGASSPGSLCPDVQGSAADVPFLNDLGLNIYAAGLYMCYCSSVNAPVLHHIQNNRRAAALCSMLVTSWVGQCLLVFVWVVMSCVVTAVSACFFVAEAAVLAASLISFVFVNLYLSAVGWVCGWRKSPAQAAAQQPGQVTESQRQQPQQQHKRDHNDLDTTTIPQKVETAAKLQSAFFIDVENTKEMTSPSTTGQAFVRLLAGRGLITVDLDQEDTYQSFVAKVRAKAGNNSLPPDGVFSFWTGKGRIEPSSWSVTACKGATLTVLMTLPGGVYEPKLELNKHNIIWSDVESMGLKDAFKIYYPTGIFPAEVPENITDFFHMEETDLKLSASNFRKWLRGLEAAYERVFPLNDLDWPTMKTRTLKQLRMAIAKWRDDYDTSNMGYFSEESEEKSVAEQILEKKDDTYGIPERNSFWKKVREIIDIAKSGAAASGESE